MKKYIPDIATQDMYVELILDRQVIRCELLYSLIKVYCFQ
jgi:hypothetical protein